MLPARNRRDLEDIPAEVRGRLEIVWLDTVEDAIGAGLDTKVSSPIEASAA
jgi:ATP-dependent Lon protease